MRDRMQPAIIHVCIRARQAKGFDWVDDTTSYGAHRWGWAGERVGDTIDLKARRPVSPCTL